LHAKLAKLVIATAMNIILALRVYQDHQVKLATMANMVK